MRALFCTVPIGALFSIRPCVEPNFGASEVVGALKEEGIDVLHLDLNAALNDYRFKANESDLSDYDFDILTNISHLNRFLDNAESSFILNDWASYLSICVKSYMDKEKIDFICFSLTHTVMRRLHYSLAGFSFSVILRKYFDFIPYSVPSYYGGKYMFQLLAWMAPAPTSSSIKSFFEYAAQALPSEYLPIYYFNANSSSKDELLPSWGSEYHFVEHIRTKLDEDKNFLLERNKKIIKPEIKIKGLSAPTGKIVTYYPDVVPKNYYDAELKVDSWLPDDFLIHFPEFRLLKPFNYYNYRFSEGCIFKCSFCYHSLTGWLLKDEVKPVVDKLERFYDSGVRYIRFFNDNINFKMSWRKEFCNEIVKRNIKLNWTDSANLKVGDRDMFLAMGEAGCVKLWYGTETASPRILKEIDKWTDDLPERIDNVLHWAHEAGIANSANLIVNFPHETNEEYEMLRSFLKKYYEQNLINCFNCQPLGIFSDSAMYKYPERFRIRLIPNQKGNWDGMSWGEAWVEITESGEISSSTLNKRGEWRTNHLLDNIDIPIIENESPCMIYENDYLFFAMVALNYNLQKKKDVYHYIFKNTDRKEFKGLMKNWRESHVKDYEKRLNDIYGT